MNIEDVYRQGMAAYHAEAYDEAITCLETLAEKVDSTTGILSRFYLARAHYEVAMAMFRQKRYQDAARHFVCASELCPQGVRIGRYLAACYTGTRQYDLAAEALEKLLDNDPKDGDARIRLAYVSWRGGLAVEALTVLTEGLRYAPRNPDLHYHLGVMHASLDEYAEAEKAFRRALELDESYAPAYERVAQICGVTGRADEALAMLRKAHAADPADARIAWQLSLFAPQQASTESIVLQRAEAAVPDAQERSAIEQLGEAILAETDFVETFLSLPESEVDSEVFSLLARTLEHALAAQPQFADLHYHCSAIYQRLGRTDQAIAHAEQAVTINPRYVNALILLARLYGDTERCDEGIARLRQSIEAGGDYADVHYLMGQLAQRSGEGDLARTSYESALARNEAYRDAKEALAALSS